MWVRVRVWARVEDFIAGEAWRGCVIGANECNSLGNAVEIIEGDRGKN